MRNAYAARADAYTALFGTVEAGHADDRMLLQAWALQRSGPVLDVGCGPGQWTAFIAEHGVDVEGVDLVPQFIGDAARRFPGVRFRQASALDLGVADGSLDGVLAWYSLIHLPPDRLPAALAEFARSIRPGGSLLIGCFDGEAGTSFPHAVVTAWFWSADELERMLRVAGFDVVDVVSRADEGVRPHLAVIARRLPG